MSLRTKIEVAAAAAIVLYGLIQLRAWHNATISNAVAQAQQHDNQAQQKIIDSAIEAREKQWSAERAELVAKQQADSKSVASMVASLNQALATAGKPPIVVVPQPQGSPDRAPVPSAPQPQAYSLPQDSISTLFKAQTDGAICRGDLSKCQADAADWKQKYEREHAQNGNLESALKGGTWRMRVRKALKCAGIAAAAAGLGAAIDHGSPARGAVIGSGSGSTACAIAF